MIYKIMPKKRKINLSSKVDNDIPYSKYRDEWIDCVSDSGWADDKEFNKITNRKLQLADDYQQIKNNIKVV